MSTSFSIIATTAFGLEKLVARELNQLGYHDLSMSNGKVSFSGSESDIARCNLWLRCADRVLIQLLEFPALSFPELFDTVTQYSWADLIPRKGRMHIVGKSIKSKLASVPHCQSITKKAIIEAMKRKYQGNYFPEDGPLYKIEVALNKDIATISLDTSGAGLHKRGYRQTAGPAPLKETLAAALIYLSRWTGNRVLADPCCGSGTIPIEAGLMLRNIAPGLHRRFVAEQWSFISPKFWTTARIEAQELINRKKGKIIASDSDPQMINLGRKNAQKAGISDVITFMTQSLSHFRSPEPFGCIICNPPYGERLKQGEKIEQLYRAMGLLRSRLDKWSYFILSAHPQFQKCFGQRADKNRKLYNGNLKCYLYSYLGPLPHQKRTAVSAQLDS